MNPESLIPGHNGYRELKSFQIARLLYDLTVRFCNRYIEKRNSSHQLMIQAARSSVENIAEGFLSSATSKANEHELTSAARANMETLRLDYEDFLRQHNLRVWPYDDRRRKTLKGRQCSTVDEVALWVLQEQKRQSAGHPSSAPALHEITANAAITLTIVAHDLLNRQIDTLAKHLAVEEDFSERRYGIRAAELAQN